MTNTDSDSDAEPESPPKRPAPHTPPENAKAEYSPLSPLHYAPSTPPQSSPPASPSFSLHSLGMSPFSPMRRQFSSPLARSSSPLHSSPEAEHSDEEELVRDSKDVLVQRLNDLATQLSRQDHVKGDDVYGLHAKVDEMEKVLSTKDHPSGLTPRRTPRRSRPTSLILQNSRNELDPFLGLPKLGRMVSSIPNIPLPIQKSSSTQTIGRQMSTATSDRIVREAQTLCKELEDVISNLRARQEESDARSLLTTYTNHIHELLITRAERAAQRIIYLEKRIKELERERNEGEMEMLNLQIQLKAIEVQCLSYVPENADQELRESISAWRTEWSALKRKRAKRKANAGEDIGTQGTPTRQPRNSSSMG
ncbi:uncharacterized protein GGS22DRAFT_191118 [Annulohypoxylon maeteangense]|uniref:uncharacterized protein n=1 Tax=Annulohypoxylon maeteangense TaxID=1927788 RepID=UPI002008A936|nr:uncharacterized protein GGS22DRAFT_191118 [Annulohypoxylon maeteangense]KAI0882528.1 hypothetical protein GGS22DRAFT_191118 [Annulohypoxylon maeteangense]